MKFLLLPVLLLLITSCKGKGNKDSNSEEEVVLCSSQVLSGEVSDEVYQTPAIEAGQSAILSASKSILNGTVSYDLNITCDSAGVLSAEEIFNSAQCDSGNDYNPLDVICEPKKFYTASSLNIEGKLRIFNLESAFVNSPTNLFKVIINDVETFLSNTQAEVTDGKIAVNSDIGGKLEILTKNYAQTLETDDEVCYEFTSESRRHCYFFQKPLKISKDEVLNTFNTITQTVDLLNSSNYTLLPGDGAAQNASVSSVDKRGVVSSVDYLELNRRAVYFSIPFTLDSDKLYNVELEVNSETEGSEAVIVLYGSNDFDIARFQQNYVQKIYVNTTDVSLRSKTLSYDFRISDFEKTEQVTVLIYGDNNILLKDFKISEVDESLSAKNYSLFMSSEPNRDGFSTNSVPGKYIPHGMAGAYGYGNFRMDSLLDKYEIYVNYEDKFKTTQAHIYEKGSITGDSLMGWNFNGTNDSAPGGNSQHFLHGSLYQGVGWSSVKANPENYVVILHSEGGHFALDGTNLLMNYNSFSHETSVGGVNESGTRFNNRVSRSLADKPLRSQNTNDPGAPLVTVLEHSDYYQDIYGTAYAQDDGFGGVELTPYADGQGYTLGEQFLFYLYDDQGLTFDSGGPEGALGGVLHPQVSYLEYRVTKGLQDGFDFDSDGVSDRIEYITHTDPADVGSYPDLSVYGIFPDDGDEYKYVSIPISKEAENFNIIVYEVLSNGTERAIWSFDRGRGLESDLVYYVYEYEDYFVLEILSKEISGVAVDLRVDFQ
ncbi:MAG: hypothetical protein ACRBBP_05815 [Bdellovibrionales bacterium]